MTAGDVIWIEFPGVVQTKRRPAVVLSSAVYHAARPDVIVGLVTSQTTKSTAASDVLLQDWQSAGLRVPSAFRVPHDAAPYRRAQHDGHAHAGGSDRSR